MVDKHTDEIVIVILHLVLCVFEVWPEALALDTLFKSKICTLRFYE